MSGASSIRSGTCGMTLGAFLLGVWGLDPLFNELGFTLQPRKQEAETVLIH